jgi:hypothetical protein
MEDTSVCRHAHTASHYISKQPWRVCRENRRPMSICAATSASIISRSTSRRGSRPMRSNRCCKPQTRNHASPASTTLPQPNQATSRRLMRLLRCGLGLRAEHTASTAGSRMLSGDDHVRFGVNRDGTFLISGADEDVHPHPWTGFRTARLAKWRVLRFH